MTANMLGRDDNKHTQQRWLSKTVERAVLRRSCLEQVGAVRDYGIYARRETGRVVHRPDLDLKSRGMAVADERLSGEAVHGIDGGAPGIFPE